MSRRPEQTFFQRIPIDDQQEQEKMPNITNHQRNANEYHLTPVEWLPSKTPQITNLEKRVP